MFSYRTRRLSSDCPKGRHIETVGVKLLPETQNSVQLRYPRVAKWGRKFLYWISHTRRTLKLSFWLKSACLINSICFHTPDCFCSVGYRVQLCLSSTSKVFLNHKAIAVAVCEVASLTYLLVVFLYFGLIERDAVCSGKNLHTRWRRSLCHSLPEATSRVWSL